MKNENSPLAWITGASSGIGRALALQLASEGWRVVASARRAEELEELSQENSAIFALPLDVTDEAACRAAVEKIEDTWGALDLAVLNAGSHVPTSARAFAPGPFRQLLDLNVMGVVNGLAPLLDKMCARRKGRIAIVSSIAGYVGLPGAGAYCMTKAALTSLAESLRPELMKMGVILQVVSPGFIKTPLTDKNTFPMPFLMPVEKAAVVFAKGLRSKRFEIFFPWQLVLLFKVLRILPYRLRFAITRRL